MKIKSKIQLAMWAILFMVTIPLSAYAADGQIKIAQTPSTTFPIVIDKPGSYVLTSNIVVSNPNVNGIEINTDNVTLDLNGHALMGPGKYGIYASDHKNIAILKGTVTDFDVGIYLSINYSNNQLSHIIVSNNSSGIYARRSLINSCIVSDNGGAGIWADYCIVTNCRISNNGAEGIRLNTSVIKGCAIEGNGFHGIFSGGGMDGSYIEGNRVALNGHAGTTKGYGIYLPNHRNYVIKNAAIGNGSGNFYADYPADNYMPTSLTSPDAANANVGW